MRKRGYLDGAQMSGTFDLLRANDLIFSYVASNWLMGQQPPAFDILAWNSDSTRMPAAMHSFYLRSLYLRNELAMGDLELAGQRLSLGDITRRQLRGGRGQRPHRAVAGLLSGNPAARRPRCGTC